MKMTDMWQLVLVLALALASTGARSFSLSRALHDVEQEVVEDDFQVGDHDPNFLAAPTPRKNHFDKYILFKTSPQPYVSIPRGHRLELTCEVDASPPPRIYWVMGENPSRQIEQLERESVADVAYTEVAREKSKLVIDCVTPQDQSLIHCVGVSADKIIVSQPTVLNVQGSNGTSAGETECRGESSAPVIIRHRTLYLTETGSTIELPCEAVGKPKPHIHWVDSEGKHLTDPRFAVQPSGSLLISNVRWQDMDEYRCIAKSSLGTSEATTFVYPASKSESEKSQANAL